LNIAIVGAGTGGKSIIDAISLIDSLKITMVIDRNPDAVGIKLAKELGFPYSSSIDDIDYRTTDIVIEATGNSSLSEKLTEKFSNHCTVLDSNAARLIMALVAKNIEALEMVNHQMNIISETSSTVEAELNSICDSIDSIHTVSDNLIVSSKNSTQYIQQSDKIIQYVNKIAKQTKILGINASIESARAGEHGKGFAVVANEVQKLANDSENFAHEINEILLKLEEETLTVNSEVDQLRSLSAIQIKASDAATSSGEGTRQNGAVTSGEGTLICR